MNRILWATWLLALLACGGTTDEHRGDTFAPGDPATHGDGAASGDPLAGDPGGDVAAGDPLGGDILGSPCEAPQTVVINISVAELEAAIDGGETLAVVDVREPNETASGIIEGALLYPWQSGVLQADHANLPDDRPLHIICASGGRSGQAAAWLIENGHTCVHSVTGGMGAWTGAGYPTVSP